MRKGRAGWSFALGLAATYGCSVGGSAREGRFDRSSRSLESAPGIDAGDGSGSDAGIEARRDAGADAGEVACVPRPNPGSPDDAEVNIDPGVELQHISGFGGINVPGWIPDLTAEQVDTAFGNGPGQIGMSILRVRISYDPKPPPELKSSNDIVGGSLNFESYGAYALSTFTTSATKNLSDDGDVMLVDGRAAVTLEGQSVTTFVASEAQ